MIARLVVLGATGDLAGRFLLPALVRSVAAGALPEDVVLVGAGPQDLDDAGFREHVAARWAEHAGDVPADVSGPLLARARYRRLDLEDPTSVARAVGAGEGADAGPVAVYLALPPALFATALRSLRDAGLPAGSRVAVEKPFGSDLASAAALNDLLAEAAGGDPAAAFRVDHVLGMPRVGQLLSLRGPGGELEGVWSSAHLEQVDLLWEESFGLRGRADFYDRTGAVKDVLQNHVVQVLVLLAMELGRTGDEQALHDAKLALLRAVRVLGPDEVATRTRRARYTAGRLPADDGAGDDDGLVDVPAYATEDGVDPARETETYAELVLEVDTPRWSGTRFVLRVGKGLAATRKGVLLHLRGTSGDRGAGGEQRWIDLDAPTSDGAGSPVQGELAAYEQVLRDLLGGGSRLSVAREEAEQAWRVVEPVLASWADGVPPLLEHPAGSPGPGLLPGVLPPA